MIEDEKSAAAVAASASAGDAVAVAASAPAGDAAPTGTAAGDACCPGISAAARTRNAGWRNKTFYQVYPMSFCDGNGDGMGDIVGITSKLDYLKELGVGYVWLTPVYVSPGYDNGYDIADYRAVDPKFGTMADLEKLFDQAHVRGMGVIMDMVVNHTSTEHAWFRDAVANPSGPYRDYYIWRRGKGEHDELPPNNWASKFGGSAWAPDPARPQSGEWYLHLYDEHQADLNWENPRVREEVLDICRFWAERGIDGFRLDVINNISKDQRFLDDTYETPSRDGRTYYSDGPRVHEYLNLLGREVFGPLGLVTVGEMSSTTPEQCVLYTRPDREELGMAFSFHHVKVDYAGGAKWTRFGYDPRDLKRVLATWQVDMAAGGGWNALFWTNHDQPRALGRYLSDAEEYREVAAKNLAIVEFGLSGTTFIYQGEEVAMRDVRWGSVDELEDVESINAYRDLVAGGMDADEAFAIVRDKSRDNCRVPMRWDEDLPHDGFSGAVDVEPWFSAPMSDAYPASAARARADAGSVWYTYQRLIALRQELSVLAHGAFELVDADDTRIFAYAKRLDGDVVLVIANYSGEQVEYACSAPEASSAGGWQVLESTHGRVDVSPAALTLAPYEALMLRMAS